MKYEQLSDEAKQKAREKLWDVNVDYQWWQSTHEYIEEVAGALGIYDFRISSFDLERSGHVQYSGTFLALMMKPEKLTDEQREELKGFIEPITEQAALCAIHTQGSYLYASITPTGRVSLNVDWGVWNAETPDEIEELLNGEALEKAFDALADWIQARLQEEYDYMTSDEVIADTIIATEFAFTEDGELA